MIWKVTAEGDASWSSAITSEPPPCASAAEVVPSRARTHARTSVRREERESGMRPNPLPGDPPASRGRILTATGGHRMDERELAESLRRVRGGSLDRREFARTLLG